ncbi:MAG: hypothetical protein JWN40_4814, partial [Phycisphaerales bacterium]|nr:hypothetical protein [Phycisphaerales bacterium]
GAPYDVPSPSYAGSAFIFERDANGVWTQTGRILASDGQPDQHLGQYVDIRGDLAIAGSDQNYGAGYVYRRNTSGQWAQVAELTGNNPGDAAGRVALYDRTVVLGALGRDAGASNTGAGLIFQEGANNSWSQVREILATDHAADDWLGFRTAITKDSVFLTSPNNDSAGSDHGSVYIYDRVLAAYLQGTAFDDANRNGVRDAGEGARSGWTVYVDANDNGIKDAGESAVVTDAAGNYAFNDLLPGSYVVRLVQQDEFSQTLPGLGDGWRVTLTPGQTFVGNFGIVAAATVVSGVTWNDRNADGVRDAVEPIVPGRTVYWDKNENRVFDPGEPSTVSGADGTYTIRNVLPGARAIRQVVPGGWHIVAPSGGDAAGRVTLAPGVTNTLGVGSFREALIQDQKFYLPKGNLWIKGTIAAVGMPADGNGSVQVFELTGNQWVQRAVLTAPDGAPEQDFGATTILIQGDLIVVAAQINSNQRGIRAGAVYVYRRSAPFTWTFASKIVASDGIPNGQFGTKLAMDGSTLMVTARGTSDSNTDGGVYIYQTADGGSTWQEKQILRSTTPHLGASFGYAISLDGPTLVVGADAEGQVSGQGLVHVFARQSNGQWTLVQTFAAPDTATTNALFGWSVSVSGNQLVVTKGDASTDKLYYYTRQPGSSTWTFVSKDAVTGPTSLSWSNGRLLAGYNQGSPTGFLSLYAADASGVWTVFDRRAASDSEPGDYFGTTVFFEGDQLWLTAIGDDDQGTDAGALYAFHIGPAGYLTGTVFDDRNADGVRNAGEAPLIGRTVFLDANGNGVQDAGEASSVSDAAGLYHFDGLLPGSYVLRLLPVNETSQTLPILGDAWRVTLQPGQTFVGNFGVVAAATVVSGVTWNDRNDDGIRDAVEAVVGGRTIYWDVNENAVLDPGEPSSVSGSDGTYSIRNVLPGPRVIRQIVPGGWHIAATFGADSSGRVTIAPGVNNPLNIGSYQELFVDEQKLHVTPGPLSMSGTIAAVGRQPDGSVLVLEYTGTQWVPRANLTPPAGTPPDDFGTDVIVVRGDLIFVTAPHNTNQRGVEAGAVYVFRRTAPSAWTLASKIVAADGLASELFGENIAFDGKTLAVFKLGHGNISGTVYMYETPDGGNSWIAKQQLTSSSPSPFNNGQFGGALSLDGDTLVIGAVNEGVGANPTAQGIVHVFSRQNGIWSQVQTFQAPDNLSNQSAQSFTFQRFGGNLSVSGNQLVISNDASGAAPEDKLYYYTRQPGSTTWDYVGREVINGPTSLAWSGGRLIAGYPGVFPTGSVSVYSADATGMLALRERIAASDSSPGDGFGSVIAFDGDRVLVSAPGDDDQGTDAGALYSFRMGPSASVTGTVFQDRVGDGVFIAGEPGLAGTTVWLDLNDNGAQDSGEPTTVTNAQGVFDFTNLMPGTYTVRVVPPPLWRQTSPANNQPQRISVTSGQTGAPAFGVYATATVTGKLFTDANANGIKDGADAALVGWVVFADLNNNRKVDDGETVAVTDAQGNYTLSYLPIQPLRIDVVDGVNRGVTPRPVALQQLLVQSGIDLGSTTTGGQTFPSVGAIAGRAAVDTDGNGLVDSFETEGVAALNFTVWRDDGDGVFEPGFGDVAVGTLTSTAGTGAYSMSSLSFGSYWMQLDPASSGMLGFSLYGRPSLKRVVVGAQQTPGVADFSILKAYTVNTLVDEIPGSNTPTHTSLREALDLVRTDGKDTGVIVFDPSLFSGTINLDPVEGQLLVRDNVSILGPDTGAITIAGPGTSRIFSISNGLVVDMKGLVITGGFAPTGGAISLGFGSTLNGDKLKLSGNVATQRGGAIYAASGSLLNLTNTTLSGNSAALQGGAIYAGGQVTVSLDRDTLAANSVTSTTGDGGALYMLGDLTARQVTIAGNIAARFGGGLVVADGASVLTNVTVAGNHAQQGGGLYITGAADLTLRNTLVAANLRTGELPDDVAGLPLNAASSYSIIGSGGGGLVNSVNGNRLGSVNQPIDARLLPLASNDGLVQTIALSPDSPALDAGSNSLVTGLATDAAGDARIADFNAHGSPVVDIGAYEDTPLIVVNGAKDEFVDTDGKMSLREAIALATARPGFDQIRFTPSMFTAGKAVVTLTAGELVLDSNTDLAGPADLQTVIDASGASRVLRIASGASVTLSNLTISGGGNVQDGAGLFVSGSLSAQGVLITGSAASRNGGGVYVAAGGVLSMTNTTVSGNAAAGSGGGLYVQVGGTLFGVNDTVYNNRADSDANGQGSGGGTFIEAAAGTSVASVTLHNTIVAGNVRGAGSAADDAKGTFAAVSSFNVIGAIDGSTGLSGAGTRYGSASSVLDAGLLPLAYNGGATWTHALKPGAAATDAGDNQRAADAGLTTDARGLPRVKDGDDDKVARVDAGAFEQQFPLNQAPLLSSVATLRGAVEGVAFDITTDQLLRASDASDPENAALGFRIESILAGSLINLTTGQSVVPGVTLLLPGQTLRWTPPAISFGSDTTRTLAAFTVRAWDGQVLSAGTPATASIEVTTVAQPVNYAVLFSGGDRVDLNYPIYYDNLKRTYQALVDHYGVKPYNIYVIYADGRDPGLDMKGNLNSDMSFAANVLPATRDNLRNTLINLSRTIDANDHFFYWTFDHGLGGTNQPSLRGEEIIKGWGAGQAISDEEQRVWLQGLKAGDSASGYGVPAGYGGVRGGFDTYMFAQCFSGGMLDNLATGVNALGPGTQVYGIADSNHYEASYSDYFASAFTQALQQGYNGTAQAYSYALAHDGRTDDKPYAPNGGAWSFNVEHPWSAGASFPIFATPATQNAAPELRAIAPLKCPPGATTLTISYDLLMAAADTANPSGQAIVFSLSGVDIGQVLRDGQVVNLNDPSQRTLAYGQSFTWVRPAGSSGTLAALRFRVLDSDGNASGPDVIAPIRIGAPVGGPLANDDAVTLQQDTADVLLKPTTNDIGVNLRVLDVGVASHGRVSFDPATGQVRYTPAAEFLGTDSFSYLLGDGVNTDVAHVSISVVSFDPAVASLAANQVRYTSTLLAPPPGWAGLGETLDWPYRLGVPNWQNTYGVDIGNDGVVVVRTSRFNPGDGSIDFVGSTNAGYRWQSGDTEPYWNYEPSPTRTVTASNAFVFQLDAGLTHNGREVFDGVEATSASNPSMLPTTRYLDPDNANESGFPPLGGIWFDAGTDQQLWQEVPQDLFPVDVAGTSLANGLDPNARFLTLMNNSGTTSGQPARVELWSIGRTGQSFLAVIQGWQGPIGAEGFRRAIGARVSAAGHAVGQAEYRLNDYHAFLYDGSQTRDLGALPGRSQSVATNLNASDVAVGYSSNVRGDLHAGVGFVWDPAGGMRSLGTLSAADGSAGWSIAYDVNASGVIVGASDGHAIVYQGGRMYDLNALVNGLPAGTVLTAANAINDAGQIVATGTIAGGASRAFFLDVVHLLSATDDAVSATSRAPATFNVLANDTGTLTVSGINTSTLKGTLVWDAQGNVTFDPAHQFDDLAVGQARQTTFSYTAVDGQGGTRSANVTITVTGVAALNTFHVESLTTTASGVDLKLSAAPDLSKLNLYDGQDATLDAADVTLLGQTTGAVRGSLVLDVATNTLSFVATGGVLAPDTYTLTLFSRADGVVKTGTGELLDGNADNIAGGNFVQSFTIAPTASRTLSLRDFARGPGQGINLPATGASAGMPISIDDAAGARSVEFTLSYDPALLTVNSFAPATGLPADWQVVYNLSVPGHATVSLFGTTSLPAGPRDLLIVSASIPATATYGASQRLRLDNLAINEGQIAARADRAVQKVAYFGDATGNRTYSTLDAALIARVGVGLDSGFDAYAMTDPAIVADVTGNGSVGALDASYVAAKSVGLTQSEIPDLPAGVTPTPISGPDPTVSVGATAAVAPGGARAVPLTIDAPAGLQAFNLTLTYDPTQFDVSAADVVGGGILSGAPAGWSLAVNVDIANARISIGGYSTLPLTGGGSGGDLIVITFHARANAAAGTSVLNLAGQLNEGGLALTAVGGTLTVGAQNPAEVVGRRLFYNHSALDGNDAAADARDDAAVANDKLALLTGQTASGANVSGAAKGINGVMIDVSGLPAGATLSAADFDIRIGTTGDPTNWAAAPTPTSITLRRAVAAAGGADRITLTWADGAVVGQWLRVTLLANAHTGLAQADTFSFASLPGDANGDGKVDFLDLAMLAQHYNAPARAPLTDGDFTGDGQVDFLDLAVMAQRYNTALPGLAIAAPIPAASAPMPSSASVITQVGQSTSKVAGGAVVITKQPPIKAVQAAPKLKPKAVAAPTPPPLQEKPTAPVTHVKLFNKEFPAVRASVFSNKKISPAFRKRSDILA